MHTCFGLELEHEEVKAQMKENQNHLLTYELDAVSSGYKMDQHIFLFEKDTLNRNSMFK